MRKLKRLTLGALLAFLLVSCQSYKKVPYLQDTAFVNDTEQSIHQTGVKVMPMEQLESFIRENDIDIAVLTIPKTSAVEVADKLVANGIRAIWNFAHVDLNVPEGIQVENVHLSDSLMKLSYNINRYSSDIK